jgi:hypothetical protein
VTFGWKPPKKRYHCIPPELLAELVPPGTEWFDPAPVDGVGEDGVKIDGLTIEWPPLPVRIVVNASFNKMMPWVHKTKAEWEKGDRHIDFIAPAYQERIVDALTKLVGKENMREVWVHWREVEDGSPAPEAQKCYVATFREVGSFVARTVLPVTPDPVEERLPTRVAGKDIDTVREIGSLPLRAIAALMDKVILEGKDDLNAQAFLRISGGRVPSQLWDLDPNRELGITIDANRVDPDGSSDVEPAPMTDEERWERLDDHLYQLYMKTLDDIAELSPRFKEKYLGRLADRMTEIVTEFDDEQEQKQKRAA